MATGPGPFSWLGCQLLAPWRGEGVLLGYCCAWGRGGPAHIPLFLQVQPPDPASIRVLRGHQLPVTCLVISPDDRFIFSASKDGTVIKCKCWGSDWLFPQPRPCGEPAAAGPRVPVEVAWPPAPPGMWTSIVLGSGGGLVSIFQSSGRLTAGDGGAFSAGEVESGKRLCVVPGGKKGTEEQNMGHASHILCMAISSDGKYLVRERGLALPHGAERWWWGVSPPAVLGSSVSCSNIPCWVKAAPTPTRVKNRSLGPPRACGVGAEAGAGRGSPRGRSRAPPVFCQATGDRNKLIMIWDTATCKRLHIFTGHHDAVSVSSGHWLQCLQGHAAPSSCLQGQVAPSSSVPLTPAPVSVCLSVRRACPSGRARTSCTVPPTTAASRSGMWRRMHTWRPCKTWRGDRPHWGKRCGRGPCPLQLFIISPSRFGHQDVITGLDSLSRECCVTAGGRDGTVRLWKIPEESQLVFYGHQ